jgi:rhamnosyltransferase
MNNTDISVVIPVKNGQRHLGQLLQAVFSQEVNTGFEVVIIDSGSTDKTLDILRQYPVTLYEIGEAEFNHGLTRNLAISKAQGRYIILMTQDAVPYDNQWMKRLVDNLKKDERLAGVYSRHLPHKDSCALTRMLTKRFFTSETKRRESLIAGIEDYNRLAPQKKHRFCNFDNVSSCIRKSVWQDIPFPEADFAEDLEWSKKVLEAGYGIAYEPDSVVYHSHDFSVRGWYDRNRVNSKILYTLFGVNDVSNLLKLGLFSFLHAGKDICLLLRGLRQFKPAFSDICLAPFFSVSGILGQYKGIKEVKYESAK